MSSNYSVGFATPGADETPKGAQRTGEYVNFAGKERAVFRERRPEHEITVLEPVMLPDGKPHMQFLGGQPIRAHTRRVPRADLSEEQTYREFVVVDNMNGRLGKEFHFRETEQDRKRRELEQATSPENFLALLAAERAERERLAADLEAKNEALGKVLRDLGVNDLDALTDPAAGTGGRRQRGQSPAA